MQPTTQLPAQQPVQTTPVVPETVPTYPATEAILTEAAQGVPKVAALVSDFGGIKAGVKTSEFLTTVLTNAGLLGGGLLASHSVWIQCIAAAAAAAINVIYVYGRTHLKATALGSNVSGQ